MSHETITQILLNALELRDKGSTGHSYRVAELALKLGQVLGLSEHNMIFLRRGSLLHDVGKIGIPDSILLKPGALTNEEWAIMRQHPSYGAEIIRPIPDFQDSIPVVLHHHEKWDGTGYPDRLTGENIPFLARVCAVAEVFDSLMSDLAYRPAWPKAEVLRMMKEESGKAFDPAVIEALSGVVSTAD